MYNPPLGFLAFGLIKFAGYFIFACALERHVRLKRKIRPTLDAQGRIANDVHCANCHYNLRTLTPVGICPECSHSVAESLANPVSVQRHTFRHRALLFVLTRVCLGMAAGYLYWQVGFYFVPGRDPRLLIVIAGLVPLRVIEWGLVLWLFYRKEMGVGAICAAAAIGTIVSFLLDLPSMMGLYSIAGYSIC